MADDRLRFILDFVTQTAGLKNAQELAELLGEDLGDAEDAGKAMATALKAAADKAQKDLAETVKFADKLGQALGPELTAKVNVDEIASKMRQVGMTTADVEANIDSFRASLTQMADTADQAKARMGDMETGVRRVGDETDRSRSVMANFTGNALQEVPMLTGAFGPLTMAAGQFAEYAAEGNISLKGLAATAAPILAVTLVMSALSDRTEKAKQHAEGLKAAQDALANGEAEAAAKKLEETFRSTYDLAEQYGIALDDVTLALMGNEAAARRVDDAISAMTAGVEEGDDMANVYVADAERLHEALRTGATEWRHTGNAAETTTDRVAAIIPVMRSAADATGDVADAAQRAAERTNDLYEAQLDLINSQLGVEGALQSYQTALDNFNKTEDDSSTLVDEHAVAFTNLKEQTLALAQSYVDQHKAQVEAAGGTYTATDAARDQILALQYLSSTLAPDNPLRVALAEYSAQLLSIPGQVSTNVLLNLPLGGSRPVAGKRDFRVDDDTGGVVVPVTVNLQFEGQTVQQITATQEAQKRGSR